MVWESEDDPDGMAGADGELCPHGHDPDHCLECKSAELDKAYTTARMLAEQMGRICFSIKGPAPPGLPSFPWNDLSALVSLATMVLAALRQNIHEYPECITPDVLRAFDAYERSLAQSLNQFLEGL